MVASGSDASKEVKEKLEARYKNQKVKVVPPRVVVGLFKTGGLWVTDSDFNVHYDHFYPGLEMPKNIKSGTALTTAPQKKSMEPRSQSTSLSRVRTCKYCAWRSLSAVKTFMSLI
jgi:hypothetical protein